MYFYEYDLKIHIDSRPLIELDAPSPSKHTNRGYCQSHLLPPLDIILLLLLLPFSLYPLLLPISPAVHTKRGGGSRGGG